MQLLLFVLVAVVVHPTMVAAQATTGAIAGIVTDQTGAALPGATIVVKQVETGATRALVADGRGRYHAPELQPGTYEVSGELQGFQTSIRRGVELSLGQELTVNLTLGLGQISEHVVVTESASLVDTTQAGLTGAVDNRQIRDLPLNGRDFSQLTLLTPGVIAVPTAGRLMSRGMGTQVSIAGARPNQIGYLLDGTDISDQGGQSPGSAAGGLLGVDTVREFVVLTNNYSAEYGRSAGGVVSAITKSGTNELRGSAFEFFRNSAMDAKNFFDPKDKPIPPLNRNQFGVTTGGPIARDKTFFFASYEGLRQHKGLSIVDIVPSRATRARADISPVTRPYILLYPEPNGPETGTSGQYFTSFTEPTNENYLVGKIDHTFSERNSLSVRYTFDNANDAIPLAVPLFANVNHNRNQYTSIEEKHIHSSHLLSVVRFAYNRTYQSTINQDQAPIDKSLYFIPGTQFGAMSVTGLTTLGTDTLAPLIVAYNTFQLANTLTWTNGGHTVKAGVSWTRWYNNQNALFDFGGNYIFGSIDDLVKNKPDNFEAMLPGTSADRYWRQNLVGLYVQDDVIAASRLTLNLGLRYEFITVPTEKYGRVSNYRDLQGNTPIVGDPLFQNPSLKNFAPRVGFAWDVFGDGKTSLRGGGGMFYEPLLANFYRTLGNRTPPFFFQASLPNPPFPNALQQVQVPLQRLDLLQFDLKNPYLLQYNLTLQREVLPRTVVTIGAVGSRGIHQIRNIEYNEAVPTILPDGRYFGAPNPVRRNPSFGSIRLRLTDGNSWFNAGIVNVTKRFSGGLQIQGSYTVGKSLDEESISAGSNDLDNGFQPRYSFDRADNRGLSDFDVRHNFVANYSYELPFGKGTTGPLAVILKGWQVAGLVAIRSGAPFTPVLGSDRARILPRSGGAGQRPDPNPSFTGPIILGSPGRYFDPSAFSWPAAGYFGTIGRNTLRGPGYATCDTAIVKSFPLGGGRRMQFRGEIFNAFNRANFGLPATAVFNSQGRIPGSAGVITSTVGTARQVQLGLKLEF